MVETLPTMGPGETPVVTIIVKGTFDIAPDGLVRPATEQLPVNFGDDLYDPENGSSVRYESDVAPYKPKADIALVGRAYAPGGKPTAMMDATLKVGTIQKTLRVIGDRHWQWWGRLLPVTASKPQPFTTMDLVYERAFGGVDTSGGGYCTANLVGRGFFAKKKKVLAGAPLPNIEDPRRLITSWKDHPPPAGFGFYGKTWSPRGERLGTYDDTWRKERAPRLPADFSFDFYNAAHPDLQVQGYLSGRETVVLHGLTADGYLRFQLPGVHLVASVTRSSELLPAATDTPSEHESYAKESIEPVPMHLDTLCVMPDERRFYMVWRGLCHVRDITAIEVKNIHIEDTFRHQPLSDLHESAPKPWRVSSPG
jgi:hypothetical protein